MYRKRYTMWNVIYFSTQIRAVYPTTFAVRMLAIFAIIICSKSLYCLEWNTSCQRIFNSEKIQPNPMPSKIIPNGWVDLDSKIRFTICHWSREMGWIWHFQRKLGCFMNIHIWFLTNIVPIFRGLAPTLSKKPQCHMVWTEFYH